MTSPTLSFDGDVLTLTAGGASSLYPAVSGKQGMYPPVPEGQYSIRREQLSITWMRPTKQRPLFEFMIEGMGEADRPYSSSSMRITLHPADSEGDGRCFIFGASVGSRNCINLFDHFSDFLSDLKSLFKQLDLSDISLTVSYAQETKSSAEPAPIGSNNPAVGASLGLNRLKGLVPDSVIADLAESAGKYGITNKLRLAHFLAQCAHESAGFKVTHENLNYSAKGLKKIFPKYFLKNRHSVSDYARQPQKIGSLVYALRMRNGNEASGEGFLYHGRGYIQLTGKANYEDFAKFIGDDQIEKEPDLVATKYPLASAAFFFNSKHLWSICDKGSDDATITAVTKRVNGGVIGLADRTERFKEFYKLLTTDLPQVENKRNL